MFSKESDLNLCAHKLCKLTDNGGVAGPCRRGDQVAVNHSAVHGTVHILAASQSDIGANCGVSGGFVAGQHACCCQQLGAMADCGNGLVCSEELTGNFSYAGIEADVLRSAAAGDE